MGLSDDVLYVGILIGSVLSGNLVRKVSLRLEGSQLNPRKWVSTFLGILFAYMVSGNHILHIIILITLNAVIYKITDPKKCQTLSLVVSFVYLFMFRFSDRVGLPVPPAHTNAIIMILTLKLVGLAFEIHDSRDPATGKFGVNPSVLDVYHYGLCHAGLITGPYYKFQTWEGMYTDPWNPAVNGKNEGAIFSALHKRAKNVPYYVVAFLLSGYLFPMSVVETPEWQTTSGFMWKVFYMMPIFFSFRMRMYAGFCLSECVCIAAGLGAYPAVTNPKPGQGPSQPEKLTNLSEDETKNVNFETIHNIDEYGADFVPTMREALKCWNMTVQHWLVVVVYKRFPVKSLRTAAVMLMSSGWHGVYSGYYLSLGSVPLCLFVEDLWTRKIRSRLSDKAKQKYDWVSWFVRMRWFDYLGMAFFLLRVDSTMKYWWDVAFVGHLSLIVLYAVGYLVVLALGKSDAAGQEKSSKSTETEKSIKIN
jgi:lysophospholipid acyltransferase 7